MITTTATRPLRRRGLFLVSTVVALVACGGGGDGSAPAPAPAPNPAAPAPPAPAPEPAPTPTPPAPAPVAVTPQIAAGNGFSLALKSDGTVASWGDQELGSLGNGVSTASSQRVPQQVSNLSDVRQTVAGQFFGLARRGDGTVFAWGSNSVGQLGIGSVGGIFSTPQQVAGLSNVRAVAAGREHALALRNDGSVLAWGNNVAGQLGTADNVDRSSPTVVPGLSNIVAVAAGGQQSFAIRSDGFVFAWGNNIDGQLGLGNNTSRTSPTQVVLLNGRGIGQIAAGRFHTLALAADGTVLGWGFSGNCQTGRPTASCTGSESFSTPGLIPGLTGMTAIAAGDAHSIARRTDGTVRTWGHAGDGRLGNGTAGITQSAFTPQVPNVSTVTAVAAGRNHTLVLLADGRVGCFGSNFFSACGRVETTVDFTTPVEVGPGFNVGP